MNYEIDFGIGEHVILEPNEVSTVLETSETATIFKVVSFGWGCTKVAAYVKSGTQFTFGDFVIVEPNSIKQCRMNDKVIYWVYPNEVVAKLKDDVKNG